MRGLTLEFHSLDELSDIVETMTSCMLMISLGEYYLVRRVPGLASRRKLPIVASFPARSSENIDQHIAEAIQRGCVNPGLDCLFGFHIHNKTSHVSCYPGNPTPSHGEGNRVSRLTLSRADIRFQKCSCWWMDDEPFWLLCKRINVHFVGGSPFRLLCPSRPWVSFISAFHFLPPTRFARTFILHPRPIKRGFCPAGIAHVLSAEQRNM